jgi:hypothetical protein
MGGLLRRAFRISCSALSAVLRERPPTGRRDLHPGYLDRMAAGMHTLAVGGCESGVDHIDQSLDRNPVCRQYRLGGATGALSKQFERAATLGIGLLARYWLGHSLIF